MPQLEIEIPQWRDTSVEMTRCQTWPAYRALKVCHIDRKFTLKPAEAGASSGPPMAALATSKCVKSIGSLPKEAPALHDFFGMMRPIIGSSFKF
jgi:hypothetical protein